MELEGSLPCSQQPITELYPEPDESSPHLPTLPSYIHPNIILTSTSRSLESSLPFSFSDKNFVRVSHLSYACFMPTLLILLHLINLIIKE